MKNYGVAHPGKGINIVLFDDAIRHLLRISRIIQLSRGSALLVGVGGSGKQTLTRLAAFIGRHKKCKQIILTKNYANKDFFEDFKEV